MKTQRIVHSVSVAAGFAMLAFSVMFISCQHSRFGLLALLGTMITLRGIAGMTGNLAALAMFEGTGGNGILGAAGACVVISI